MNTNIIVVNIINVITDIIDTDTIIRCVILIQSSSP